MELLKTNSAIKADPNSAAAKSLFGNTPTFLTSEQKKQQAAQSQKDFISQNTILGQTGTPTLNTLGGATLNIIKTPAKQETTQKTTQATKTASTPVATQKSTAAAPITQPETEKKLDASNSITVYNSQGQGTIIPAEKFFDYQNQGWTTKNPAEKTATGAETGATTRTSEEPVKETSTDSATKITSMLNKGYDNAENIATATGLTVDEVNNYLSSDTNASFMLDTNKITNKQDQAYKDYQAKMDSITNGTFALTPDEQADIQNIRDTFDRLRESQVTANKNYEGAIATGEARSGRLEFMNQISSGIQKQAIDDGVQKIKDIESAALSKVREYKTAVQDKNYKAAGLAYEAMTKYLDQKSKAISDLHTATVNMYKAQQDSITKALENQKLKQEIAKTTIEGLTPSLQNADSETIDAVAKYYGLDPNMITGSIKATAQKSDAEMAQKGYRTISPADAGKVRATGAEVVTYNGRTYAKEPEIKSVTNKGYIDFFKGTKKIASVPLTGGGSGSGSTKTSEEKSFESDLKQARQKIANDPSEWGAQYNYLVSQYGLQSAEDKYKLDQLLNKELYIQ